MAPKPELEQVLGKTLGVPFFQEQAMKWAIACAGVTPGEADQLRKSMATFKFTGGVSAFCDKLISGMVANIYEREFAEQTFRQLEGFGSCGFPESHAAFFALIAYASSWVKCWHPDVFCAALKLYDRTADAITLDEVERIANLIRQSPRLLGWL